MNQVLLYTLYITLYIPIELLFIILLINWGIYQFIVFLTNTYYYLAQKKLRLEGKPFSRILTHKENMFFWIESPTNLSYITIVSVLARKLNIEQVKKLLIERQLTGLNEIGEALFPTLRQVRVEGFFFSTWEYPGDINIDDHVTEIEIDMSIEGAVENFFGEQECVSLPKEKPRWHLYILSDSNLNKSTILYKFHHSVCDGMSAWKVIMNTSDVDNREELELQKLVIVQLTLLQRIFLNVKTFISIPIYLIDNIIFGIAHWRQYVNGITGKKKVAWTNKLDFEKIREIKKKTKTTVNDVVMTLLTEAMRRYFIRHGRDDVINREIVFGMGVALEGDMKSKILTNNLSGLLIIFPTNIEGTSNQLKQINHNMNQLKRRLWPLFTNMLLGFIMTLPLGTSLKKYIINANGLMIGIYTNAPGPNSSLKWNGTRFDEAYGLTMTSSTQSIGACFLTYKGVMHFAVKVDTVLMEEPKELIRDVENVLEDMYSEISSVS